MEKPTLRAIRALASAVDAAAEPPAPPELGGQRAVLIQTLGACCACEQPVPARNIKRLELKAPVAGTGWGCKVCKLPRDGALAVLCDECAAKDAVPVLAVLGYANRGERVAVTELSEVQAHDWTLHKERQ